MIIVDRDSSVGPPYGEREGTADNLGNVLRTLPLPETAGHWSLTPLRKNVIKVGAKVVRHGRYGTFQMAEVAVARTAREPANSGRKGWSLDGRTTSGIDSHHPSVPANTGPK